MNTDNPAYYHASRHKVRTRRPARSIVCAMTRMRRAAAMLIAVVLLATVPAVSGCGAASQFWQRFNRESRAPLVPVDTPEQGLVDSPIVAATRPSVVKIHGLATGCQKVLEGSGFVVAPHKVMSSAHVVAGADSVSVEVDGQTYDAQVVSQDPNIDISILDVPDLAADPLTFAESAVTSGTDALMLGYPGGGPFVAAPARIREMIKLDSPDIYHTTTVTREVYTITGNVKQGDSGGPLIDTDGRVLGVVFGAAVDEPEMGFVLTAGEVAGQMANVGNTAPVATGACVD
jgi:S1-C subfamily serine protease